MLNIFIFFIIFIYKNKFILFSASIQRIKAIAFGQKYLYQPSFFREGM